MQAISDPVVLEMADEARKAVTPNDFVNSTLNRKSEEEQLRDYFKRQQQKTAEATAKATAEEMITTALKNNVPLEAIEAMRKTAGITESKLTELKQQLKMA